jgi:histone acetyltransferase (RNA polymerase elongator complex component)
MPGLVIPIFIPHLGCTHRCVFCNQNTITGHEATELKDPEEYVNLEIIKWLNWTKSRDNSSTEVAFFGGNFTGLTLAYQDKLLSAVKPFFSSGKVDSIRISTRPDNITENTPLYLKSMGVQVVELGVQSMNSAVLAASGRDYPAKTVKKAITILKEHKFKIGVQLMIGLPGETTASQVAGVRELIKQKPDFARIYPTLVIKGSKLARDYEESKYKPLSMNKAIALAARVMEKLKNANIPVVRTGLQPSMELEKNLLAGPYHPAFGECVKSRLLFKELLKKIIPLDYKKNHIKVLINPADQSILRGNRNINFKKLAGLGILPKISIEEDLEQKRYTVTCREN